MTPTPDAVFAGHDATRTGAPLMYLYFLRWLREHTDLTFEIVLVEGGPLVDDFAAVAPVTVVRDLEPSPLGAAAGRLGLAYVARAFGRRHARQALAHLRDVPFVYCNTVNAVSVLPLLEPAPHDRVVVTHVHEMAAGFKAMWPDAKANVGRTDEFVAASELVRMLVIDHFGAAPDQVTRHYEFIDVDAMASEPPDPADVAEARAGCGIPEDAVVVGAVGVTQWRKGPDLFLLLARLLTAREEGREVHLVWLGADPDADETIALRRDIERAGLADRVHLVAPVARPARWFALFDVFVLTSREDPFPLVCLESSLLGTPIVCFDNTGMAEFAGDGDCGYIVDYLDVEAMADRVSLLLDDPDLRHEVGARAAARVRTEFDVSAGAPALYQDVQRWRGAS